MSVDRSQLSSQFDMTDFPKFSSGLIVAEDGVSEMKELLKEWGEDVEGSGQVHPVL
jgi:hypothetical protein